MSRLIDADALIEVLKAQDYFNAPNTLEGWTPQDMTDAEIFDINNAPTVDAVEVVRCKDCVLFEPNNFPIKSGHPCSRVGLEPNDFCSWAETEWREDECD